MSTKTLTWRRQEFQIDEEEELSWSSIGNGQLTEVMQEKNDCHPWNWSNPDVRCIIWQGNTGAATECQGNDARAGSNWNST